MTVASRNGHLDIVLMLALGRQDYYGQLLSGNETANEGGGESSGGAGDEPTDSAGSSGE
jgi:hypothetical protein